mmetsp:Transcript_11985/g.12913  ORF Transcript_11985/g.12913 Transcript_11985/m.12913 type:complete len:291 (+) Transcript_11985:130-1002(+)|eukprot:gene3261-3476_t
MSDASGPLITVDPPSTLVFRLERGSQARTILKVTNVSPHKVVFKVKTTQPTWYYVRPNQQILDAGSSEDVNILLVDTECNRFLDQIAANENNTDKLEKHRFLVQSKVIDEDQYDRIRILPSAEKTDELSKLWDGPKDDKKNIKLKVDFKYPDNLINSPITKPMTTIPENIESIRNKINPKSSSDNNSNSNNNIPSNSSPEVIFSELQNLRKKYDAVVEYTVHLTAERDSIVNQLDLVQRELNKEKSKKKEGSGSGKLDKNEKRVVEKGFSLFVVILTAIICFILGKYFMK